MWRSYRLQDLPKAEQHVAVLAWSPTPPPAGALAIGPDDGRVAFAVRRDNPADRDRRDRNDFVLPWRTPS